MSKRFEYGTTGIKDIVVPECAETETTTKKKGMGEVLLDGEPLQTTKRFWNSLHLRFGFTSNIFRYFSPAEVFDRISEVAPNDEVRWCVERDGDEDGDGKLLAVTSPGAALMQHDDLMELLDQYDAGEVKYSDGVVSSCHAPRLGGTFK